MKRLGLVILFGLAAGVYANGDDQNKCPSASSNVATNQVKPSASLPVSEEKYEQAKRDAKFLGIDPRVISPNVGAPAPSATGSDTNKPPDKPQSSTR